MLLGFQLLLGFFCRSCFFPLLLFSFRSRCNCRLDLVFFCVQSLVVFFQCCHIAVQLLFLPLHLLLGFIGFRIGLLEILDCRLEFFLLGLLVFLLAFQIGLFCFQFRFLCVAGFQLVLQVVDQLVVMICHTGHQFILGKQVVEVSRTYQSRSQTVVALYVHGTKPHLELVQSNGNIGFHDLDVIFRL